MVDLVKNILSYLQIISLYLVYLVFKVQRPLKIIITIRDILISTLHLSLSYFLYTALKVQV